MHSCARVGESYSAGTVALQRGLLYIESYFTVSVTLLREMHPLRARARESYFAEKLLHRERYFTEMDLLHREMVTLQREVHSCARACRRVIRESYSTESVTLLREMHMLTTYWSGTTSSS